METKTVVIGEKSFIIKEISLEDALKIDTKDNKEFLKKLLETSVEPPLTEELRKTLSMKEGFQLVKEINEFNGLDEDFLSSLGVKNIESGK